MDALDALDTLLEWAAAALVVAVGVLILATFSVVGGPLMEALDRRFGSRVGRYLRSKGDRPPDAAAWLCAACNSANTWGAERCYRCQAARPRDAVPLPARGADDLYERPPRVSRFDPSRYRGPGAPPPPDTGRPLLRDRLHRPATGKGACRAGVAMTAMVMAPEPRRCGSLTGRRPTSRIAA